MNKIADPLKTLGVPEGASEEAVRLRYLELVKQFPPERDPERFREIHTAYEAAKDPLVIARRLLEPPDSDAPPRWSAVIDEQKEEPPALGVDLLLSLGNCEEDHAEARDGTEERDATEERDGL